MKTGKVLFIGVRNKYCSLCEYYLRNSVKPKVHRCFKNYESHKPSTGMESEILVEGFKSSIEMHGLIYKTVISDGDSNVFKSIIDNNVYKEHNLLPSNIRCYNHLHRNLSNKLQAIAQTVQKQGTKRIKNFSKLRNAVKGKILQIRQLIDESVDYIKNLNMDKKHKEEELRKDILNIPYHVFGQHKDCLNRDYNCTESAELHVEDNVLLDLKEAGLFQKVEEAMLSLSRHCESLLLKVTNNKAESFNNIVCVDTGGKRVNYALRCQYDCRAYAAVVKHNSQQFLTEVYRKKCNKVPYIIQSLNATHIKKVSQNRLSSSSYRKTNLSQGITDKFYGPQSQQVDMEESVYKSLIDIHFQKLLENQKNRVDIEKRTRGQSQCMEWLYLRKHLLTASHFGEVIRRKKTTSCAMKVKGILYPSLTKTVEMQYGIDHESDAIRDVEKLLNIKIHPCGLFIDPIHSCLACSPDGKIEGQDGIVEIKCCMKAENVTAEEAIKTIKSVKTIFKYVDGNYVLNPNHKYYFQVQGQLNVTRASYCIFALWTPKSILLTTVQKSVTFW